MNDILRPVWAEVNINAIRHNIRQIKGIIKNGTKIIAVIKADAYGHGAVEIARTLISENVDYFAVAILDEAIELRKNGILKPILILGYTPVEDLKYVVEYDITQTVFNYKYAEMLSKEAVLQNKRAKVHVKIDTGMGRIGYTDFDLAFHDTVKMSKLKNVDVEGIFTHFSTADEVDKAYTIKQYNRFADVIKNIESKVKIPLKHASNSAAILDLPDMTLNAVRPGIILYGHYPSESVKNIGIVPSMSLIGKIIYVKDVDAGTPISYGRKFVTQQRSKIATVPIGYADGYTRLLSGKARVIINNQYAPVVGNICMDQLMIDVTGIDNVKEGDEVIFFGKSRDLNLTLSVEELAEKLGTINYEILCTLGRRIPRIYKEY